MTKEKQLFGEPLPISPTTQGGLDRDAEKLWVDRLLYAKQQAKRTKNTPGREKAKWLKLHQHCRNYLCAANYLLLLEVAKKIAFAPSESLAFSENLVDELQSYLGELLAYAVDTYDPTRAKLSTHIYTVLIHRGNRFFRKEKKYSRNFRLTDFKLKGKNASQKDDEKGHESSRLSDTSQAERRETSESVEILEIAMKSAKLTNPERLVLDLRFRQDMTLEDAGKQMKLTRERIRQIQAKALAKLRAVMETT